jgi:archaeal flagellar protein FlaJ
MKILRSERTEQIRKETSRKRNAVYFGLLLGIVISLITYFLNKDIIISSIIFFITPVAFFAYSYYLKQLRESDRVRKMEEVFPDFLQLMASNLRAGMTIDKAMLLSTRKEFAPLDIEIQKAGREIATGKNIDVALANLSLRVNSPKIEKTVLLIISGLRTGGNMATLLEETSSNMREKFFVEKRASSNVLMYVIFIFIAVAVGAPVLFGLSSLLVETLTKILSGLPEMDASVASSTPFTMSSATVSLDFIKYFSLIFIIVSDILAVLVLGLVSKGEEKAGLKYLVPILLISILTFFAVRMALSGFISGLFG